MEKELLDSILIQNNSIQNLIQANTDSSYFRIFALLGTSLVSTILGAILAYIVGNATRKRSKVPESAKYYVELLNSFEELCIDYWSKPYDLDSSLIEEAKIKVGHQKLRSYFENGHYGIKDSEVALIKAQISKLFDAATGGDFESKKRKASPQQIRRITMITSRITPILIKKSFD